MTVSPREDQLQCNKARVVIMPGELTVIYTLVEVITPIAVAKAPSEYPSMSQRAEAILEVNDPSSFVALHYLAWVCTGWIGDDQM